MLGGRIEVDGTAIVESPEEVRRQVRAYEAGDRRSFDLTVDLPDALDGDVLRAVGDVSLGRTTTYGEIAADLGTAPVAVGAACARNPVPLVVPCHRVVGSDGSLRGYPAPGGTALKRRLLDHEARIVWQAGFDR